MIWKLARMVVSLGACGPRNLSFKFGLTFRLYSIVLPSAGRRRSLLLQMAILKCLHMPVHNSSHEQEYPVQIERGVPWQNKWTHENFPVHLDHVAHRLMRQWHFSWDRLCLNLQLCLIDRQEVMDIMPVRELRLHSIIRVLLLIQKITSRHLEQPKQNTVQLPNNDDMWLWLFDSQEFEYSLLIYCLQNFTDLFLLDRDASHLAWRRFFLHWRDTAVGWNWFEGWSLAPRTLRNNA